MICNVISETKTVRKVTIAVEAADIGVKYTYVLPIIAMLIGKKATGSALVLFHAAILADSKDRQR